MYVSVCSMDRGWLGLYRIGFEASPDAIVSVKRDPYHIPPHTRTRHTNVTYLSHTCHITLSPRTSFPTILRFWYRGRITESYRGRAMYYTLLTIVIALKPMLLHYNFVIRVDTNVT